MTVKNKRKITIISVLTVILVALSIWIAWDNKALELNAYTVVSDNLPESFDGFQIAHISDLHNAEMGDNNEKLITMLKDAQPDIIVITGDLIDSRHTDIDVALSFVDNAVNIAPCYYVTGNHEARIAEYEDIKENMKKSGAVVLEDEKFQIEQEGETITVIGVDDPRFEENYEDDDDSIVMKNKLNHLAAENEGYTILLSHRPELFDVYQEYNIDIVFSGHAHGGQIRLPFVGGIFAPKQGFFPEYDSGLYTENGINMIVSRGIGNSSFPFRINNPPEVVLVELDKQ